MEKDKRKKKKEKKEKEAVGEKGLHLSPGQNPASAGSSKVPPPPRSDSVKGSSDSPASAPPPPPPPSKKKSRRNKGKAKKEDDDVPVVAPKKPLDPASIQTCVDLVEEFWDCAWSICAERFLQQNAPVFVSLDLRDTWLRIVEAEWLDQDQPRSDMPADVFKADTPPLPLEIDTWSRGALDILPQSEWYVDLPLPGTDQLANDDAPLPPQDVIIAAKDAERAKDTSKRRVLEKKTQANTQTKRLGQGKAGARAGVAKADPELDAKSLGELEGEQLNPEQSSQELADYVISANTLAYITGEEIDVSDGLEVLHQNPNWFYEDASQTGLRMCVEVEDEDDSEGPWSPGAMSPGIMSNLHFAGSVSGGGEGDGGDEEAPTTIVTASEPVMVTDRKASVRDMKDQIIAKQRESLRQRFSDPTRTSGRP